MGRRKAAGRKRALSSASCEERARIVAFGVGEGPVRLSAAEAVLAGARLDAVCARAAGVAA